MLFIFCTHSKAFSDFNCSVMSCDCFICSTSLSKRSSACLSTVSYTHLVWGQRHLRYLKEYRRAAYITLLTSGRLNAYLADIDRQAQERMERLTEQMKQAQGITEQLKVENALEWTQRMNNLSLIHI